MGGGEGINDVQLDEPQLGGCDTECHRRGPSKKERKTALLYWRRQRGLLVEVLITRGRWLIDWPPIWHGEFEV